MDKKLYGLIVEFETPELLLEAARRVRSEGYRETDAYTPFPVEGLWQTLQLPKTKLPWLILCGGLFGGLGGFFMMWFSAVIHLPINVGGRPLFSWVAFIPITFELTVLFASFAAVFGMLGLNGLPKPYHPVFNVTQFERASLDHFFLCIKSHDLKFDKDKTRRFLENLGGLGV